MISVLFLSELNMSVCVLVGLAGHVYRLEIDYRTNSLSNKHTILYLQMNAHTLSLACVEHDRKLLFGRK